MFSVQQIINDSYIYLSAEYKYFWHLWQILWLADTQKALRASWLSFVIAIIIKSDADKLLMMWFWIRTKL